MSVHRSLCLILSLSTLASCTATSIAIDPSTTNVEPTAPPSHVDVGTSTNDSRADGGPRAPIEDAELPTATLPPIFAPATAATAASESSEHFSARQGDWELTLGGTGSSDKNFDQGGFNLAGGVGLYLTDYFELGVRQNANLSDFGSSNFTGSTALAADINFFSGALRPVLGVNVGYVYGDNVHDTWEAAPEAGFKWYLQKHAFLQAMMEYQFFFQKSDQIDDAFKDGQFVYSLLLGINF